jgi:hypothetical protein
MAMPRTRIKISTIVRLWVLATGLAGCAAAPLDRPALACADERLPAVCSTFAAESRCTCASRNDLERLFGAFGAAAWPGAIN